MPSHLSVDNDRRSRSKSPGGRDRDRSHSRDTRSKEVKKSSRKYDSPSESESDHRHRKSSSKKYYESESEDDRHRSKKITKKYSESESEESDRHKKSSRSKKYYESDSDDHRHSSKKTSSSRRERSESESDRRKEKSKKSSNSKKKDESQSSGSEDINISIHRKSKSEHKSAPQAPIPPPANGYQYAQPAPFQYAAPGVFIAADPRDYHNTRHGSYIDPRYAPAGAYPPGHSEVPGRDRTHSFSAPQPVSRDARDPGKQYIKTYNSRGEAQYVEVKPEPTKEKKYREDKYDRQEKRYHDDKYRDVTPEVKKMEYLAIGGGLGATLAVAGGRGSRRTSDAGGKPPASPLLEAYRGTYQSISPMPSALVLRDHKNDSDLSDLDLSEDSDSDIDPRDPNADLKRKIRKLELEKKRHEKQKQDEARKHLTKEKSIIESRPSRDHRSPSDVSITTIEPDAVRKPNRRTVVFYDPEPDAKRIAAALAGTNKPANPKPLLQILPFLSSDDLFALRMEYKNQAKVGGAGINIAKHIKTRIPGNLGKVMYATALGRWESEAFWANSFYQGGNVRRELLIESLMGRSNSDIREIKNCFKDKKYGDDLEKCMKAELKADKFRTAILLALEERRGIEGSGLDLRLVQSDVVELHQALAAPSGGETAMIQIIVVRSDAHLREVLKVYEKGYRRNFARDMIERSRNLVVCALLYLCLSSPH
jgi:hypothetical protein